MAAFPNTKKFTEAERIDLHNAKAQEQQDNFEFYEGLSRAERKALILHPQFKKTAIKDLKTMIKANIVDFEGSEHYIGNIKSAKRFHMQNPASEGRSEDVRQARQELKKYKEMGKEARQAIKVKKALSSTSQSIKKKPKLPSLKKKFY